MVGVAGRRGPKRGRRLCGPRGHARGRSLRCAEHSDRSPRNGLQLDRSRSEVLKRLLFGWDTFADELAEALHRVEVLAALIVREANFLHVFAEVALVLYPAPVLARDYVRGGEDDLLRRVVPEGVDAHHVHHEVLHAVLCHHAEETPLTKEAGVIRIADGLDMERGRSRIPYKHGGRGINTISSQAIEDVRLKAGDDTPVLVEIEMNNAAGVYQVDTLLKAKLANSRLESQVRIIAVNTQGDDGLVERIEL